MLRIALGVIAGFFAWMFLWVGVENVLSAVMPDWYGAPQAAFQAAIEKGGQQFTAEARLLVAHVVIVSIVSAISGYLAATAAGENSRAPVILGVLLLTMGLAKAAMSWQYVPMWYHIAFTVILLAMPIIGGKMRGTA
jgi:hypothetical protein